MSVVAVVVNWQNWAATEVALESLLSLTEWQAGKLSICAVDNGSTDDSAERMEAFLREVGSDQITMVRNRNNRGYAAGCNAGIQWALARSAEYVWLLNNDVEVGSEALSALLDCARKQPDVLIWGSTVVNFDTGELEYAGGGYYNPWLSLQTASRGESDKPLDFVFGAAMFLKVEVFEQVGLLNEEYFLYYEELDLVRRLGKAARLDWCRGSIVKHVGAASTGESTEGLKIRQYHENLSTFKFTRTYYSHCLPSVIMLRMSIKPILFLMRGQIFLAAPLLRSLHAALRD